MRLAVLFTVLLAPTALTGCLAVFKSNPKPETLKTAAVPVSAAPGARFVHDFRSWQEIKQHNVVMQQHDYSCGAAALATMIQYYFQDKVTEAEILNLLLKDMSATAVKDRQANGLSMDDLFQAAEKLGYQATVYPLELAKLKELEAPVIVRLKKDDFKHFVVLRGIVEDRVWVADPIRGNVRMKGEDFARQWNSVALFMGKSGFGLPKQHPLAISRNEPLRPELQSARRFLYLGR